MAKINYKLMSDIKFNEMQSAYYGNAYEFTSIMKNIVWAPHHYENTLDMARFLQNLMKPTWIVSYEAADGVADVFRSALLSRLRLLNAEVVYTPKHTLADYSTKGNNISLSHHTIGKKHNVWHYKVAYLPNFFHFDRNGYSGWSELADEGDIEDQINKVDSQTAENFYTNKIIPFVNGKDSKYKQNNDIDLDQKNFVFIPMQVINDSVMSLGFQKDYIEALRNIINILLEEKKTVIVKRHPKCSSPRVVNFIEEISKLGVLVSDASIHRLIPACDFVVTLNSGVGFEALAYLKPVICLGKSDYSAIAYNVKDSQSFKQLMQKTDLSIDEIKIKKFLYLCLNKFQVDIKSDDAMMRVVLRALAWNYVERNNSNTNS